MKLLTSAAALLFCTLSGHFCMAQYGQDNSKLNPNINSTVRTIERNNPMAETIYLVDTSVNHVDFGTKKIDRPFDVVFHFKSLDLDKPYFRFKKSQITGTNMTPNSGISKIELTTEGVQVTYIGKKLGPVDDFLVIHTEEVDLVFRLTGEIIPKKKTDANKDKKKPDSQESGR